MRERKKPVISGLLSIVPGIGHFYINEPFTGSLYLFLFWIGGLIMLLVSRSKGNYKLMWVMTIVIVISLIHVIWDTKKYNRDHDEAGDED